VGGEVEGVCGVAAVHSRRSVKGSITLSNSTTDPGQPLLMISVAARAEDLAQPSPSPALARCPLD
jgi:hypothetical protein